MSIQRLDDNKLVNLYIKGNEEALAVLVDRHKRKIYYSIFVLVKDKELTEDFFQDAWIKVIQSLKSGSYYDNGKFCAWVIRIAHNLVIDYFRRSKKMRTISKVKGEEGEAIDIFSVLDIKDTSRTPQERADIKTTVRALITELPKEQKETVIMRAYYDMSFKEIAEITNVSLNTALGRMRYALINLKKLMVEQEVEISL